ncbi:sensor histidine kinase [Streptomyces clavuligerus]|uniref:histidine kinase n=1 Tax=Streptomyces clavuligerus TaxID=1901 RepID=B5GL11_STRCL|nr:HAMP domain-containing sensor histidine kinase [Streptomyces clavuligerus]ANW18035.1 two-component sensor histidine kinase [Streptomyces clavuligerus]AXU12595.1 sensor histidine kinase [Streptomyces clavuligerus]EDY47007.1 sensor kinase [Streptomyces clavuligerus]EFG09387.1 Sensor protein [Streptomyces clavuligerus]MBY6302495.1 HAMP domain-containing histidine kinase [Streptomyces clavuligerus]
MRSVRAKATVGATLVVAVALIAAGLSVLLLLRQNLEQQAALEAEVTARETASRYALGQELDLSDAEERPIQIVDENGCVVAASPGLERISGTGSGAVTAQRCPPPGQDGEDTADGDGASDEADDADGPDETDEPDPGQVSPGRPGTVTGSATVNGDTARYRFAAVEATSGESDVTVTVWAGAPLTTEENAVGTVRDAMLVGLPALLLVVAAVTWLVTSRALRPVEGIRREMEAITHSEDLSRRVPEPDTRDEVALLARTTNETLTALEASVERQRRFVADASHELRSPIASLRTQLEVGAAHPELLDVPGAVADTVRLQQLAADLLLLARLDAGERPAPARVDLGALAREEVSQRSGDTVPVAVTAAEGLEVNGSRSQLARVLGNLLDNAQRHARASVAVTVRSEGRDVVVEVADDGEGVPEAERERIFERFVRLDDARTRDEGGAGLGLAIARDVAVRHGGGLTVAAAGAGGALFRLRLPAA